MIRFKTSPLASRLFAQKASTLRQLIVPCVLSTLLVMLGFQAIQGERGYLSLFGLEQDRIKSSAKLETLKQQNEALLHDITLLSADTLDLDFLDERARSVLGYVKSGDTVLILR